MVPVPFVAASVPRTTCGESGRSSPKRVWPGGGRHGPHAMLVHDVEGAAGLAATPTGTSEPGRTRPASEKTVTPSPIT